jgi:hypothetical protein
VTREPVTTSGWYRHTATTSRYYGWQNGRLVEGVTVCTSDRDRYEVAQLSTAGGQVPYPTKEGSLRADQATAEIAEILRRGRDRAAAEAAEEVR